MTKREENNYWSPPWKQVRAYSGRVDPKLLYVLIAIIATTFFISGVMATTSATVAFLVVLALGICVVSFANTEIALYVLVFSMLLSPEIGQRTTEGAGITLRVDDFLLVLIGFAWLARTALYKELGIFLRTKLNKPIFFYLLACVSSTAIGMLLGNVEIKSGFFFVLKYFEYYVVYFMVVNHIRSRKQVQYLIVSLLLTCVIVDIIAMAQIPSGRRLSAPFEGAVGEPNTFGGYLLLMLAMSTALFTSLDSKKIKASLLLIAGLSIIPFLLSLSRGSYLALVPAYFTLVALSKNKGVLISIILLACLIAPYLMPDKVTNRITHTFSQRVQEGQEKIGDIRLDTSTSARLRSWMRGFDASTNRPIFGYGITGWHFIDNQFMRVLVETGLLGLTAFIFLLYSIFREGWKVYKATDDKLYKGITMGFLAGLVGLVVHSLGANTFIIIRIMEPFWLLAGIVMVIPTLQTEEAVQEAKQINGTLFKGAAVRL
jgi:O-antigen ligase